MQRTLYIQKQCCALLTIGVLALSVPAVLFASTTDVVNSVHIHATSGGNTPDSATREGSTTNSVFIHTEVNGEIVEHYEATSSDPIHYEYERAFRNDSSAVEARVGRRGTEQSANTNTIQTTSAAEDSRTATTSRAVDTNKQMVRGIEQGEAVASAALLFVHELWSSIISFINSLFAHAFTWK